MRVIQSFRKLGKQRKKQSKCNFSMKNICFIKKLHNIMFEASIEWECLLLKEIYEKRETT